MRTKIILIPLAAISLLLATTASAGKGNSSITLVMISASTDGSGPHFGDQVTFSIATDATDRPWVNVNCYQNDIWVYGQWQGFFPTYLFGQIFTLGPTQSWTGGAADCTARLVEWASNGKDKTLASTSFHVDA